MPIDNTTRSLPVITELPEFCEYAAGSCNQTFENAPRSEAVFLYPGQPLSIASTIEGAVEQLRLYQMDKSWVTWKDFGVSGQIIYCRICQAMRFTNLVVADISTLNFNLMFEIGYALGLGKAVLPIRDSSYAKDKSAFGELGIFDTLGYADFQNSSQLVEKVITHSAFSPVAHPPAINKQQPIYLVKSKFENEGQIKLLSALKKAGLRYRSFDPIETPRLTLHEAFNQVYSSLGVIVHLIDINREGAVVSNARCAFVAGLAMAAGKRVVMLQEGQSQQPIDYRDVVLEYSVPAKVPELIRPFIPAITELIQDWKFESIPTSTKPLEKLDLGDVAAENEIKALSSYFVATNEFNEAKRGHARLVVGRKGAGKTAIFYSIWGAYQARKDYLVLDLKPEGHQFTKLREFVLNEQSTGLQSHILTAFWNYLLLMELAHKIIYEEKNRSYESKDLRTAYLRLEKAYGHDSETEQGDFSERLLELVDRIVRRRNEAEGAARTTAEITRLVYDNDIKELSDALSDYISISKKKEVWLLFDNLDKGWPIQAATEADILLLRCLLDATRKLQHQLQWRGVDFREVVFIRNDIYQHLLLETADRGKDAAVLLAWDDDEAFKEMIRRRISQSTNMNRSFEELWSLFFPSHVNGEESFGYILARTLMRPREVISILRRCIGVAVNRGHDRVLEADIIHAEKTHSETALIDITLELRDVSPEFSDVPYVFIGSRPIFTEPELKAMLREAGIDESKSSEVTDLLLWFGFIGIYLRSDEEKYAYQFQYDIKRMKSNVHSFIGYCIHPAFRLALGIS